MSLPANAGARFVITPSDHAGLIVIVTAVCLCWSYSILIIRVVSKAQARAKLGLEELLISIATILATISSSLVFAGIAHGLGRQESETDPKDVVLALKYIYAADIFYVLGIAISKSGALPLVQGLTPVRAHILACRVLGGFVACWTIVSLILVAIRCHTSTAYMDLGQDQCSSLYTRWVAIESLSIVIELAIFALSISIVWIVKLAWSAKAKVIFAFSTRLPIIIAIAFRLRYLDTALTGDSSLFGITNAVITTQVVLHYTIMSGSFAYLKPFLSVFDSQLCATVKLDTMQSYNSSAESRYASVSGPTSRPKSDAITNSYRMSDLEGRRSMTSKRASQRLSAQTKRQSASGGIYDISFDELYATNPRPQAVHPIRELAEAGSPSASMKRQDQLNVGLRHSSSGSEEPIITKTQEWDIYTEIMSAPSHAK